MARLLQEELRRASIAWSEPVDEALCYGWIDSKAQAIYDDRYEQYCCPRKPTSPWSKINETKIKALEDADQIHPAGAAAVEASNYESGAQNSPRGNLRTTALYQSDT